VGKAGKKNTPKNILQDKLGKAAESPTPEQEAEPVEIGHEYGHEYTFEQLDRPDGLYWRIVGDRPIKLIGGSTLDTSATPQSNPPTAPVRKLSGKEWVGSAYRPELLALTITDAGKVLAQESKTAPDCRKPLSAGYCTNELRKLNRWPPKPRSPK
jgi:hypothetical protein